MLSVHDSALVDSGVLLMLMVHQLIVVDVVSSLDSAPDDSGVLLLMMYELIMVD